jgi:predicted nucleic acid-binding protein
LLLLEAVERGRLDLVWSPALTFETIRRGPPLRAEAAERVRRLASHHVGLDDALVARARALTAKVGLQAFDALHLAAAQAVGATLVSVDRKLLRRGQRAGLAERVLCDPIVAVTLLAS